MGGGLTSAAEQNCKIVVYKRAGDCTLFSLGRPKWKYWLYTASAHDAKMEIMVMC
jgi:hypothetical protein